VYADNTVVLLYVKNGMVYNRTSPDGISWSSEYSLSYSPTLPGDHITGGVSAAYCPNETPTYGQHFPGLSVAAPTASGHIQTWNVWSIFAPATPLYYSSAEALDENIVTSIPPAISCPSGALFHNILYADANDNGRLKMREAPELPAGGRHGPYRNTPWFVHSELPAGNTFRTPALAWRRHGSVLNDRSLLMSWFSPDMPFPGGSKVLLRGGLDDGSIARFAPRVGPTNQSGGRGGLSATWATLPGTFEGFLVAANVCVGSC
jgi:hypothetical protein